MMCSLPIFIRVCPNCGYIAPALVQALHPMVQFEVRQLGHRFGRRILFRKLSFTGRDGDSVAVTGANGSGKSTLMRILAGVLRPARGEVSLTVDGVPVAPEDRPLQVGMVAPYLNVYDGFSTRENLQFIARVRRLDRTPERIREVLDLVGLAARADDRVETYSSGMKQRVRFAAALLPRPPVLLLDEPTSNLDDRGREMVDRVMAHHLERGGLLLVATNIAGEADKCGARVCIEDYR